MPQHFGYLEEQADGPDVHHYKSQFREIMHYKILIEKNKCKPGDNSRKMDYYVSSSQLKALFKPHP